MKNYTDTEVINLIYKALNQVDLLVITSGQRDGFVELDYNNIDKFLSENNIEKPKYITPVDRNPLEPF
jgi:hypothetical protein